MNDNNDEETDLSVMGDHVQLLESNALAVFTCQPLLQRTQTTVDGHYAFLQDHQLRDRIEKALAAPSTTRVQNLWWLLGWKKEVQLEDQVARFLASSVSLYDVTLVSPHSQHYISLASYLQAISQNPYRHIQRLEIRTAFLPLPTLCQSLLRGNNSCLKVLDLKGRVSFEDNHRLTLSMDDLELFTHALAQNRSLKALQLEAINFYTNGSSWRPRHNRKKQQQNQSIANLTVHYCRFDSPLAAQRLMNAFAVVEEIHLRANSGLESWVYQLYKPPSSLTSFHAANTGLPKGTWLQKFLQCNNLRSFSIGGSHNAFEERNLFLQQLGQGMRNSITLQSLNIANPIDSDSVGAILTNTNNVTSLSFSVIYPTRSLALLASPQIRLQTLKLHVQFLDALYRRAALGFLRDVISFLDRNRALKQLDLIWYTPFALSTEEAARIPASCWVPLLSNLQRFSVTKITPPPHFYEDLFQALLLTTANSQLTDLELGWMSWNDAAVNLLCQYLKYADCPLENLCLRGAALGTSSRQTVSAIFDALTENTRLRSLHVYCHMTDLKYAVALHLANITGLQNLILSLEFDGGNDYLPDTHLGERAIQTDFLRALCSNQSICHINVEGLNPYEYWFSSHLTYYNLRNKVDSLFTGGSPVPLGIWSVLLEHLQRKEWCPSIVFHILVQSVDQIGPLDRPPNQTRGTVAIEGDANDSDGAEVGRDGCGGCLRRFRSTFYGRGGR